jgi:16S rRNA (guanine1207-N2)-methyltransferase
MIDAPLETLFLPFLEGRLAWPPDGALFLRARAGAPLDASTFPGLVCEQSFKPDAEALDRAGFDVQPLVPSSVRKYSLVLALPPRQRDESRALLARALTLLAPGGVAIACAANNDGARSVERDLERLAGPVTTMSKNKCRVFWTAPLEQLPARALLAEWGELDAIRPIEDGRFFSRPGIFAWNRIDAASRLLAAHLPSTLAGRAADLGAGFGYLSAELLARCPGIVSLDVYEAEARALDLARGNLASLESRFRIEYLWHDVTAGLARSYDVIVCNPPFHTHAHASRPDVGRRFIAAAAQALAPGGRLFLVANRHLPYESALDAHFESVRTLAQLEGFKVVEAVRASAARLARVR